MVRTLDSTIAAFPRPTVDRLPAPTYVGVNGLPTVGLAVESMKRHMSDEGWQLFSGLETAGYLLCGKRLPIDEVDVPTILAATNPGTVVVQDKREWDLARRDFRDPTARFLRVNTLRERSDIFKVTVLKDAHQRPDYHRESAYEIGCHAWIIYYHPLVVARVAPYVRPEHLIRTYHSIDADLVPSYTIQERSGCLLSGATSRHYPLRCKLTRRLDKLPDTEVLPHPGYHRQGCCTPEFLQILSLYKVAICTSSIYGYALRKIVEATACGCVALTDLPTDDVLPEIDDNLVRVDPSWSVERIGVVLHEILASYNPSRQEQFAQKAKEWYDYRAIGRRLAEDIERLRVGYSGSRSC